MRKMSKIRSVWTILLFLIGFVHLYAYSGSCNGFNLLPQYVSFDKQNGALPLVESGRCINIYVDEEDWDGVKIAAGNLSDDIFAITGVKPGLVEDNVEVSQGIIVGTVGRSKLIDRLVKNGIICVDKIKDQWEAYVIQTVGNSLVIAGSDKRGTIYGIYDLSEKIGVSPWYYWADVPIVKHKSIYIRDGIYIQESPKVKYRGIFLNDEWPSLGGWVKRTFGGFNTAFHSKLFELLLRLKANFLWPAMWDSAFYEDDPDNGELADKMGIVMGTSHHEPMMRAHKEYTRRRELIGPWNYATNKANIDKFFIEGVERSKNFENIITIGMRGDGDTAMGNGGDEENMKVLRDVIKGQRNIIENVYAKKASEVPQLWAIFTEVQRYYDAGFNVPDDVTLLFCDNNWGHIRRIGPKDERKRKGGLGLYYHIDMNGGPASDRWVNTTTIPKLHEQLNLAYQTGIDRIWVINVGDLKPKELPIDFIMRYAWNPDAIPADNLDEYLVKWSETIFGEEYADEIAEILSKYPKYNLLRKAEVQNPFIFSHVNHKESDNMLRLWNELVEKAEKLEYKIKPEAKDAYYQLVLYPVKASAGVAKIYIYTGKNNLFAKQGRVSANDYADMAGILFEEDKKLTSYYNDSMSDGKWNTMMSDNHIGYISWQIPQFNSLPDLDYVTPLDEPVMGIAIEGSALSWPNKTITAALPVFDFLADDNYYIDVFNKGIGSFEYIVQTSDDWICTDKCGGTVEKEGRIMVSVDWGKLKNGTNRGCIAIKQDSTTVNVEVVAEKYSLPEVTDHYYGGYGEFSIPSYGYNRNISGKYASWIFASDLGRGKGCMKIDNVDVKSATIKEAPVMEYDIFIPNEGAISLALGILPTQDVYPERGLRMAVSIDSEPPVTLDMRKGFSDEFKEYTEESLKRSKKMKPLPAINMNFKQAGYGMPRRNDVFDGMRWIDASLGCHKAGMHTLKIYMIDPEIVLERIIVNPDNEHPSYNGKPEVVHNSKIGILGSSNK